MCGSSVSAGWRYPYTPSLRRYRVHIQWYAFSRPNGLFCYSTCSDRVRRHRLAGANLVEVEFSFKEDRALFSSAQKRQYLTSTNPVVDMRIADVALGL